MPRDALAQSTLTLETAKPSIDHSSAPDSPEDQTRSPGRAKGCALAETGVTVWDVKSLGLLILVLVALALAAVATGVLLLVKQTSWELELAKWLLTLGVGLLTAGAIAGVYKMMDLREGRAAGWRSKLVDLTGTYDTVLKARMRMIAHKSARTYSLEMENLVGARESLRRAFHEGEVDSKTRAEAKRMWKYLEALGLEYQDNYFRAARQQRADEALVEDKIKRYVSGDAKALDDAYFTAPPAYLEIEAFEKYGEFIDQVKFPQSDFIDGHTKLDKLLKGHLRARGVPARRG